MNVKQSDDTLRLITMFPTKFKASIKKRNLQYLNISMAQLIFTMLCTYYFPFYFLI